MSPKKENTGLRDDVHRVLSQVMVYMVPSKNYKGIEYIQLADLPREQQEQMQKTLNREFYIKILVNGEIISNCVQYKDYRKWYETIFRPAVQEVAQPDKRVLAHEIALKTV